MTDGIHVRRDTGLSEPQPPSLSVASGKPPQGSGLAGWLGWWMLAALLPAAVGVTTYGSFHNTLDDPQIVFRLSLFTAAAAAAGYVFASIKYRLGLKRLSTSLVDASNGHIHPATPPEVCDTPMDRLYRDYNETILTLGNIFSLVEDCQKRVLRERNQIDVVMQALPAAVAVIDEDLCITVVNRQAEEIFGYDRNHLQGRVVFDFLPLQEADRELMRDAFLYNNAVTNQVIHLGEDRDRWLSINLSFINIEEEDDMAAVITLMDITEYKMLQESAYAREKLVSMGQLAAGVAHELNTPLGSILGYAQLLQEDPGRSESASEFADIIGNETRRCSRVVQNLLSFARKEHCDDDECDVNGQIEEIVDTLCSCRIRPEEVEIVRDFRGRPTVWGGCGTLDIVVTNLLLNSVQALKGHPEPRIRIATEQKADRSVLIIVEDNGPGVPQEHRSRLFEPFFTTKDVGDGSGLGLSISHALITKRGGSLRYDTTFNKGARFIVRLPTTWMGGP